MAGVDDPTQPDGREGEERTATGGHGSAAGLRRLSAMSEMVAWGLAQRLTPDFYRGLLERVAALAPEADAGSLLLRGADGRFRFAATLGFDIAKLRDVVLAPEHLSHDPETLEPLQRSRPYALNTRLERRDRDALEAHGAASRITHTLVLPLVTGGAPLGFLYLDRLEHDEPFPQETMAVAQVAAAQASLVVQRLKLDASLRQRQDELERFANYDALTGLPNRGLFLEQLRLAVEGARRRGRKVGLMFLDLDGFKGINDTLGHEAGDDVLVAVAQRMNAAVRAGDSVGRLGGDEFTVLVDDLDDARNVARVAEKMLAAIAEPLEVPAATVRVTASIGIAIAPDDADDGANLLRFADIAMYRVKALGRAGYQFFTAELDAQARDRLRLIADLRTAIAERSLTLAFQPQVVLADGSWDTVEALARWCHPERGWVPPATFVRAAVESGQVHDLAAVVVDMVLSAVHDWRGHPVLGRVRCAFNVTHQELLRGGLGTHLGVALAAGDLDPARITVELPERTLVEDPTVAAKRIDELRALGVGVALDDYGAGHSSLAQLRLLPLTVLKIDRSLVAGLGGGGADGERDAAVVGTLVTLGATLGCRVVAEGVETEAQRRVLLELGCGYGQGRALAVPMRADELTEVADLLVA